MTANPSQIQVDKARFLHSIEEGTLAMSRQRQSGKIHGGIITLGLTRLEIPENLLVVGDLHGDLGSLESILFDVNYKKFLSDPSNKAIFLGDYVDRGTKSIEVLQAVCDLKSRYSESVILMRGNHEAPTEFPFDSHNLPFDLNARFGVDGKSIYGKILEFFRLLTLVTIINDKIFLVHGGPPTTGLYRYDESLAMAAEEGAKNSILEELLWNDPRALPPGVPFEKSRRIFGRHYGAEVSRSCLDTSKACAILRSHEPCHTYRLDHGGKVLTLFSCGESYPKHQPGYLLLTKEQLESAKDGSALSQHIRKIKRRG